MPGERLEDALAAAASQARRGVSAILTNLGESLTSAHDASAVTAHYLDALTTISETGIDAQLSVKPTQLGLDVDFDLCLANLQRLLDRADALGNFVWIDMESSPVVDRTLELFRRLRARSSRVGIALQAY